MSSLSQFVLDVCRRPTLSELQTITGFSTLGSESYTDTNNQTGEFIDTTKIATNGSRLICKNGGVGWIVAPSSSEVSRTWYCINDAKLSAQRITQVCCTQWFVPTCGQLQNPGYNCRTYWDSYLATVRWSSTEGNSTCAWGVTFTSGNTYSLTKTTTYCVRAFRCVTY